MDSRKFTRLYRFLSIASLAVLLLLPLSGVALAGQEAPIVTVVTEAVALPAGANVVMEADAARSAATDAYPNIESRLAQMMLAHRDGNSELLATFGGERHLDVAAGTARVILEMGRSPEAHAVGGPTYEIVALPNGTQATIEHAPAIAIRAELEAAIAATGATYETAYENWVQVLAPLDTLEALSKIADVARVRLPYPAQQHALPGRATAQPGAGPDAPAVGTYTSEGVSLTGTAVWHTYPSDDGTGVNLAVFDFGFTNWTARKTSGDLPSGTGTVTKDYSSVFSFTANSSQGTAGYDHGTACAEIAFDMAPAATVYLYAWNTDVEFGQAVADYETNAAITGKKTATMSIGWNNAGPYDGSGPINTIVDTAATTYGIFWANSAGNSQKAHDSFASSQYSTGNYVSFGGQQYNVFGPTSTSCWSIPAGYTIDIFLEWNDWQADRTGNVNEQDYDLYLYKCSSCNSSCTQVASSLTRQCNNTANDPTEGISYTPTSAGYYRLAIQRFSTTGCTFTWGEWLDLYSWVNTGASNLWRHYNYCNSLTIPADSTGAVATGATFWNEDATGPSYGLEPFSSLGPRNASGGGSNGTTVNKPDVVAPDGVSTVSYGASNGVNYVGSGTGFFGTSGAAPHVAGIAATYWETYPSYTLAQLRSIVQTQAVYKAAGSCGGTLLATGECAPGTPDSGTQNNSYGWGRINRTPPSPQAVDLAGFTATAAADGVTLAWETVSETDNAGFNVYRAAGGSVGEGPQQEWTRVNESLIPALTPGSAQGNVYAWTDSTATAGTTWYMLEDVDLNGAATRHEPVSVTAATPGAEPNAVSMTNFGAVGTALPALAGLGALALAALAGVTARKRR